MASTVKGITIRQPARLRGRAAATAIALGPRILCANTAALAALALWQGTAGDLGGVTPRLADRGFMYIQTSE